MTTTQPRPDFTQLDNYITDDVFAAMVAMYHDRASCGWHIERPADIPIIAALQTLRDETTVNFIQNERRAGFIEMNQLGRMYVIWRQGMRSER